MILQEVNSWFLIVGITFVAPVSHVLPTVGQSAFAYDAGNRLLSAGSINYTYDDNGNRLTKGGANYTYNSLNQLTQVSGLVAGTVTYTYDGQGRRVEKNSDDTIRYYYDGPNPVAQANEGDKLLRSYTWGDGLIQVTNKQGDTSYATGDLLGSVNTLTISEETIVGTASASSSLSGHPAVKAVDEKEGSYWDSGKIATTNTPTTLTLNLQETLSIKGIAWVSKAIEHAALLYRIDTSTDNTNWTTLITGSTSTDPSPDLTFTPTNARYVKITVTQNNYTQTQQGNRTITEGWQVWEMWAVRTIPLTTTYSYKYDPYGNPTQTAPEKLNNFTYTGKEYDDETGLYYFGARYYDPEVGRWLSPDPLGMVDGVNTYLYVHNNPVNLVDPLGLLTIIVHGTYSGPENIDPDLIDAATKTFNESPSKVHILQWSGGNNDAARRQAARELANFINSVRLPEEKINIVAHSHGGNVALLTSNLPLSRHIDNLVLLATPVREYKPNSSVIGKAWSVFSPYDQVQNHGGGSISLFGHEIGGAGRTFNGTMSIPINVNKGPIGTHSYLASGDAWRKYVDPYIKSEIKK